MAARTWTASGTSQGRALLVHGLTSLGDTWWRVGPALATRGWDVIAVDQAGHGDCRVDGPVDLDVLVDAVLAASPEPPRLLLGHSLGTLTCLAVLDRHPDWAETVVLEDPPVPAVEMAVFAGVVAQNLLGDAEAVARDPVAVAHRIREECPRWHDTDVEQVVEGIARMDAPAFAAWLGSAGGGDTPALDIASWILASRPEPYVLAARSEKSFLDGGSALSDVARERLRSHLPPGHVIDVEGGHCLHRDAPEAWLGAVQTATGGD